MADLATSELNIDTFKAKFETGARAYLFYVEPRFPQQIAISPEPRYLVKTSSLPSSTVEEVITPWQGFDYKTGGKRTYNNWTVTFNTNVDASIRRAFLQWQDLILNPASNLGAMPSVYFQEQRVTLLDITTLRSALTYLLKYAWPTEIGDLQLDYGQTGEFASFDVTFSYTYFTYE